MLSGLAGLPRGLRRIRLWLESLAAAFGRRRLEQHLGLTVVCGGDDKLALEVAELVLLPLRLTWLGLGLGLG